MSTITDETDVNSKMRPEQGFPFQVWEESIRRRKTRGVRCALCKVTRQAPALVRQLNVARWWPRLQVSTVKPGFRFGWRSYAALYGSPLSDQRQLGVQVEPLIFSISCGPKGGRPPVCDLDAENFIGHGYVVVELDQPTQRRVAGSSSGGKHLIKALGHMPAY